MLGRDNLRPIAARRPVAAAALHERPGWGVAASVGFHASLAMVLLLLPPTGLLHQPAEDTVAVQILSPSQFEATVAPPPAPAALPRPAPEPAAIRPASPALPAPKSEPDGMIRAKKMFAADTLADPRSRSAVKELATFSDGEKVAQLCNLEAMGQVHAWRADFRPDRVVPYALKLDRREGDTIVANGAAFRSERNWYALKFKCQVAPDHRKVVAFEFQVGDPVPKTKWEELNLPAVH